MPVLNRQTSYPVLGEGTGKSLMLALTLWHFVVRQAVPIVRATAERCALSLPTSTHCCSLSCARPCSLRTESSGDVSTLCVEQNTAEAANIRK